MYPRSELNYEVGIEPLMEVHTEAGSSYLSRPFPSLFNGVHGAAWRAEELFAQPSRVFLSAGFGSGLHVHDKRPPDCA